MRWLVIAVLGLTASEASAAPRSSPAHTATVSRDSAEFFFPVPNRKGAWELSGNETAPGALAFGWTVEVVLGSSTYRVSAQEFRPAAAKSGRGTFEDLTHRLQADVWKSSSNGQFEAEAPARAYAEPGGLLLRASAPRFLERLRAAAPKTVVFRTEGAGLPAARLEVPVTYRDAPLPLNRD